MNNQNITTNLRILLVDDNIENRTILKAFLKNSDITIDEAENGQIAINKFKSSQRFDLIFMDLQMPILDGFETTKEIRSIERESKLWPTPIIALSAHESSKEKDLSISCGCWEFITKPIGRDHFISIIKNFAPELKITLDHDYSELIPEYLSNRVKEIQLLEEMSTKQDFEGIRKIGHRLKGSAGSYGLDDLGVIGGELETNGLERDLISILMALGRYRVYLNRLSIVFNKSE